MRRREKFIISSILLSLGLLGVQYIALDFRFIAIFIFTLISYLVSAWALYEDLYGVEWATIIPLPAMYSAAVAFFYFLLPSNIWSRLFILGLFGVGMYAIYLTANIYSVAKVRTIQLLRAAHAIGLLFTLLISALFANTIFSFRLAFWFNGILLFITHFPLFVLSIWAIKLRPKVSKKTLIYSTIFGLVVGELGIILSFLPVGVWTSSLVIASSMYVINGIMYSHLQGRLFKNTLWEYLAFACIVLFSFFFLVTWK